MENKLSLLILSRLIVNVLLCIIIFCCVIFISPSIYKFIGIPYKVAYLCSMLLVFVISYIFLMYIGKFTKYIFLCRWIVEYVNSTLKNSTSFSEVFTSFSIIKLTNEVCEEVSQCIIDNIEQKDLGVFQNIIDNKVVQFIIKNISFIFSSQKASLQTVFVYLFCEIQNLPKSFKYFTKYIILNFNIITSLSYSSFVLRIIVQIIGFVVGIFIYVQKYKLTFWSILFLYIVIKVLYFIINDSVIDSVTINSVIESVVNFMSKSEYMNDDSNDDIIDSSEQSNIIKEIINYDTILERLGCVDNGG